MRPYSGYDQYDFDVPVGSEGDIYDRYLVRLEEMRQSCRILDQAKREFAAARINTSDGCRFDFDDGWLHLRTSNTEPVMRAIVEADDEAAARRYLEAVAKIRASVMGPSGGAE